MTEIPGGGENDYDEVWINIQNVDDTDNGTGIRGLHRHLIQLTSEKDGVRYGQYLSVYYVFAPVGYGFSRHNELSFHFQTRGSGLAAGTCRINTRP